MSVLVTVVSVVSRAKAEYERVSGGFGVQARGCGSSDGVWRGQRYMVASGTQVMGRVKRLMMNGKRKTWG